MYRARPGGNPPGPSPSTGVPRAAPYTRASLPGGCAPTARASGARYAASARRTGLPCGMDRRPAGVVLLVLALVAVMVARSIAGLRPAGSAVPSPCPTRPGWAIVCCRRSPIRRRRGWPREIPYAAKRSSELAAARSPGRSWRCGQTQAEADEALTVSVGRTLLPAGSGFRRTWSVPAVAPSCPADRWTHRWPGGPPLASFRTGSCRIGGAERRAVLDGVPGGPDGPIDLSGTLRGRVTPPAAWTTPSGLCWSGHDLDRFADHVCPAHQPHSDRAAGHRLDHGSIDDVLAGLNASLPCPGGQHHADRRRHPRRRADVIVDPFRMDGAQRPDAPLSVNCFVTSAGPQQLTGTVIGLGARPIPFEQ